MKAKLFILTLLIYTHTFSIHTTIKNIVFDIGGVILQSSSCKNNPAILEETDYDAWKNWNRGLIDTKQLIKDLSHRFNKKDVEQLFAKMLSPQRPYIDETITIIRQLKNNGYNLFILSNFSKDSYRVFIENNDFFSLFDGMIFSWQVGYIKPEHAIYQSLFTQYSLLPEECVFIDDKEHNIDAFEQLGGLGIVYEAGTLANELRQLEVRV